MLHKSFKQVITINNKKGIEMVPAAVITFVLLGILFFVYLAIFRPTASEAGTFFSSQTLKAKDEACLLDGQRATDLGKTSPDTDGDGRLDRCDICLNGDNELDADGDGMPDYCDKDPTDPTVNTCRFRTTKDGRCEG